MVQLTGRQCVDDDVLILPLQTLTSAFTVSVLFNADSWPASAAVFGLAGESVHVCNETSAVAVQRWFCFRNVAEAQHPWVFRFYPFVTFGWNLFCLRPRNDA